MSASRSELLRQLFRLTKDVFLRPRERRTGVCILREFRNSGGDMSILRDPIARELWPAEVTALARNNLRDACRNINDRSAQQGLSVRLLLTKARRRPEIVRIKLVGVEENQ